MAYKAPFIWFGGKRKVASEVWAGLGDVPNYVEPFAGSLAVLLGRRDWEGRTETVNDKDAYIANLWRSLANDPDEVAYYADWPVNETDLVARHLWLVNTGKDRIAKMESDPDFFDAKVAGWWVWGINSWIGSGWCSGNGPHKIGDDGIVRDSRQLPHLGDAGRGVNRQLPHLGDAGQGVNRKRPHLGTAGQGVNRKRPHLGDAGQGEPQTPIQTYLRELADRLRNVRVCCGDWSRVVTDGATSQGATVGVFLDPPYLGEVRDKNLYSVDDHEISHEVRRWALSKGDDPRFRIVLAGYAAEHEKEMPSSWRVHKYSAGQPYGTKANAGKNKNRHEERLWFSPRCVPLNDKPLFAEVESA